MSLAQKQKSRSSVITGVLAAVALLVFQLWGKLASGQAGPPDGAVAIARDLATKAPLAPDPYFLAALDAEAAGKMDRAEALVDVAVRRSPRHGEARLWRLAHYLGTGRIAAAIEEAAILSRVRPEMSGEISAFLAEAARARGPRRLIAHQLANSPLIVVVTRRAAALGVPVPALLELVTETDLTTIPGGVKEVQYAVVQRATATNNFAEARAAWLAMVRGARPTLLFDEDLNLPDFAPPFAWTLHSRSGLETIPQAGGGIRVRALGGEAMTAAEQQLVLTPGSYVLAYAARGAVSDVAGWSWRLSCPANDVPLEVPVESSREAELIAVQFAVPTECAHQRLELRFDGSRPVGGGGVLLNRVTILSDR